MKFGGHIITDQCTTQKITTGENYSNNAYNNDQNQD